MRHRETGKIEDFISYSSDYQRYKSILNGIISIAPGQPVTIVEKSDIAQLWNFERPIVSNIAVGDSAIYFFTSDSQLVALNSHIGGDILGFVEFTPPFPEDFSFRKNLIIVAVDDEIVAVDFEDSRQLSIFSFNKEKPSPH